MGDAVVVGADVFADGHGSLACRLLYRREADAEWSEAPMQALVNDRSHGGFRVDALGRWRYTLVAWVDPWTTWRRDLQKRLTARQDVTVDLRIGAELVRAAAERAEGEAAAALEQVAVHLENPYEPGGELVGLPDWLDDLMERHADRSHATTYAPELAVVVDRERARFSAWYDGKRSPGRGERSPPRGELSLGGAAFPGRSPAGWVVFGIFVLLGSAVPFLLERFDVRQVLSVLPHPCALLERRAADEDELGQASPLQGSDRA